MMTFLGRVWRVGVFLALAAGVVLFWLAVAGMCTGCAQVPRLGDLLTNGLPPVVVAPPGPTTTTVPAGEQGGLVDAVDLSNAVTHGTEARRKPQNARIVCALGTVRVDADKMHFDLTPEARKLMSGESMGHVLIFTLHDGVPDGGQFDFMRKGGQSVKLLENIYGRPAHGEGPRLGRVPEKGATYWVVLMNAQGTERTAAVEGLNKWVGR